MHYIREREIFGRLRENVIYLTERVSNEALYDREAAREKKEGKKGNIFWIRRGE